MTEPCNCDSPNPYMGPWHAIGCCTLYAPTATHTAAQVKVLTEAALRLGRKEACDEAIERLSELAHRIAPGNPHPVLGRDTVVRYLREIASQPAPDATSGRTDPSRHQETGSEPQAGSNRLPGVECSCYKLPRQDDGILRHHPECPNSDLPQDSQAGRDA